jgi:hypothetical protein
VEEESATEAAEGETPLVSAVEEEEPTAAEGEAIKSAVVAVAEAEDYSARVAETTTTPEAEEESKEAEEEEATTGTEQQQAAAMEEEEGFVVLLVLSNLGTSLAVAFLAQDLKADNDAGEEAGPPATKKHKL